MREQWEGAERESERDPEAYGGEITTRASISLTPGKIEGNQAAVQVKVGGQGGGWGRGSRPQQQAGGVGLRGETG